MIHRRRGLETSEERNDSRRTKDMVEPHPEMTQSLLDSPGDGCQEDGNLADNQDEEEDHVHNNRQNRKCCDPLFALRHHFFLLGSSIAVIASSQDFYDALSDYWADSPADGTANDDDDAESDDGLLEYWTTYKVLMTLSTTFYLLDSINHIVMQRRETPTETSSLSSGGSVGLFTAMFGLAAFFDLASSVAEDEDIPWPSFVLECLSVALFFICAALTIWSKRKLYFSGLLSNGGFRRPPLAPEQLWNLGYESSSEFCLVCLGDFFLFVGCTVDVVVGVIENRWHQASWLVVSSGGLLSSILWCLDAILYKLADADIFDGHPEALWTSRVDLVPLSPSHQDEADEEENGGL